MTNSEIIDVIVGCAMEVRSHLTPGFEEKVYKNAMFYEMTKQGLKVDTEVMFQVKYKDLVVGTYRADIVVEGNVIVELKATNALTPLNEVQLVNYLTATGIDDGLLINFGSEKIEIRHRTRLYNRR